MAVVDIVVQFPSFQEKPDIPIHCPPVLIEGEG
jgi:hypothetical protein